MVLPNQANAHIKFSIKLLNRLVYRNMFKNTCFYGHSEHVNFAVQGSFLASPSLLHKELTHKSNRLSSRNLINQTSCLSTKVRRSYGTLFRGRYYFIRNGRNPFGNPEYLTQVLICHNNIVVGSWYHLLIFLHHLRDLSIDHKLTRQQSHQYPPCIYRKGYSMIRHS